MCTLNLLMSRSSSSRKMSRKRKNKFMITTAGQILFTKNLKSSNKPSFLCYNSLFFPTDVNEFAEIPLTKLPEISQKKNLTFPKYPRNNSLISETNFLEFFRNAISFLKMYTKIGHWSPKV